jgi:hypothetical protein
MSEKPEDWKPVGLLCEEILKRVAKQYQEQGKKDADGGN